MTHLTKDNQALFAVLTSLFIGADIVNRPRETLRLSDMSDLKLTPSLLAMLERIEQHNGTLLMLSVTASGRQDGKLNKLRGAG